jgi:hypothetical protein
LTLQALIDLKQIHLSQSPRWILRPQRCTVWIRIVCPLSSNKLTFSLQRIKYLTPLWSSLTIVPESEPLQMLRPGCCIVTTTWGENPPMMEMTQTEPTGTSQLPLVKESRHFFHVVWSFLGFVCCTRDRGRSRVSINKRLRSEGDGSF